MQQLVKDVLNHRKKNDIREVDLLQSVADLVNKGKYNFKELVEDVFNIFVDNIIHSYGTLLFCLYELASNKQIQQCVIEELVRLKPDNNKSLQLESLRQLPYLDAVVKETLRKYPAVPTIIRKCNEHCSINGEGFGFELPKGTLLFYSVMGVHRDPSNYPDPNKFDPDRFIEAVNKQCDTSDTYYMPFGIDNTKNIGLRFTTLHIKLSLISIFTKYKVKLNNVCPLEFDNKKLPLFPKEPVPICFESL
ncbi:hypothetical protein NQ315_013176 [Exocentrus adspersus]|uniref:Cytochrome P450 n=1 Tax=Exocentrus adspersus TaxID=1586481 RepID=A0AAV8VBV2_9CUCU|nr:hypothetical protein NQ315_013176 [Exocentrus adspersus]